MILDNHISVLKYQILRRQKAVEELQIKYKGCVMPPEVLLQLQNTERKIEDLQHQLASRQSELDAFLHGVEEP